MNRTAILGFGNPVRSDDAVGCYVIEKLKKANLNEDEVSLIDMGTSSFEVLFQLQGHDRLILVDGTINSGEEVGTLFKLPAQEVMSSVQDDPMVFLHSLKWDQALSYAKKILQDQFPDDIQVYLIAIDNTKLEVGMSESVENAGQKVSELILEDLANLVA
ncbi:MAG: hydrogenase maturation protease [Ekhidna sp.]|nr:hydrogenase maturation protease [Ekhidna sp.]